jgi:hypothetical protein
MRIAQVAPLYESVPRRRCTYEHHQGGVHGMARAKLFRVKKMGVRMMIDVKNLENASAENTQPGFNYASLGHAACGFRTRLNRRPLYSGHIRNHAS